VRGAGVIEVDVRQEDRAQVRDRQPRARELGANVGSVLDGPDRSAPRAGAVHTTARTDRVDRVGDARLQSRSPRATRSMRNEREPISRCAHRLERRPLRPACSRRARDAQTTALHARRAALIDPGPSSTLRRFAPSSRAGVGGQDLRAILLTHIHFDHAGATGTLVREHPALRVYVHENGAPHMSTPRS